MVYQERKIKMVNYENFSPEVINTLQKLNEELLKEEKKDILDKEKILKLKYQILMRGLEMSIGRF